jgi:glycosyltransferase involved in cell wall biosynthesis
MPSRYEPWGFVFHEAMGHARPCIGARACAMPEIIDDGRTGLLVEPGDVTGLAGALATLLADPDRAAAMGRAAHDEVHERHRWTDVADRILPVVRQRVQAAA